MRRKGTEKMEEEAKIRKRKKKSITENKKIYFFVGDRAKNKTGVKKNDFLLIFPSYFSDV